MLNIVFRTILIYLLLLFAIRLMGKRQIGELQTSELITTILLSEIAAAPINNRNEPLRYSLVPICILVSLEILISILLLKSNFMKRVFYGSPSVLIRKGKIDVREMRRSRMEIDELVSELRQAGYSDPSDVYYAILEENGHLSAFPKADKAPATPSDLGLTVDEKGLAHLCVIDGSIVKKSLTAVGWDEKRLEKELKKRKLKLDEVFALTVNDAGEVTIVKKE